ncbi:MAG: radical SAM protein [Candidatus Shapirobacteria bacterium]|nr:radical SAM protein [Candidatus Shapirobacteria bacterium]
MPSLNKSLQSALENIYVSPLELCNLSCRACYTKKTKNILSNKDILDFIEKYQKFLNENSEDTFFSCGVYPTKRETAGIHAKKKNVSKKNFHLNSVLFCGGEVFTLSDFPNLINTLIQKDIFITIITNGTINCINKIKDPKNCQLLVSLDGPKEIHDKNRGPGNFDKTINFIDSALQLGFPVEVMFLITKDSYPYKDSFDVFGLPKTYLTDRKMSLSKDQLLDIKKNYQTFPNKNLGCFQLSLQSSGIITGCCESSLRLGTINDDPATYVANFIKSLSTCSKCQKCHGCCDPNYLCGYKTELKLKNCQDVVQSFK